jgi:hypothetical protein
MLSKALLCKTLFAATMASSPALSNVRNGPPPPGYKPPVHDQQDDNPGRRRQMAPSPGLVAPGKRNALDHLLGLTVKSVSSIGETATFKVVYGVSGAVVKLVDVNQYKYHFDYASQVLRYRKSLETFNLNYNDNLDKREFVLGSVTLVKDKNEPLGYKALFELWSGDTLDSDGLLKVMNDIQKVLPENLSLKYHPLSTEQEVLAKSKLEKNKFILTQELIGNRSYLIFNKSEAYGYLRFATKESDAFDLRSIVVYDQVPNDVGLVGGVITAEPQTPLSHVNVKSMNRNTMNIFLKDARNALREYENKPVHIVLKPEGPEITVLEPAVAEKRIAEFWKSRRPKLGGLPQFILDPKYKNDFVPLYRFYQTLPSKSQHSEMIRRVGAKAANLALLNTLTRNLKLSNVVSPETLGVPFNFYEEFMNLKQEGLNASGATSTPNEEVQKILTKFDLLNTDKIHSAEDVHNAMTEIKEVYAKAKVPDHILLLFKRYIIDDPSSPVHISKHPRLRLRSSTNSEDLDGFTGAGLYDSDGISLYKKNDDGTYDRTKPLSWEKIEKKLREVLPTLYSGVWNERAFQEREWFQINGKQHLDIKVGLAFHGAFPAKSFDGPGEIANGVAVTTNIYNPSEWGKIYLNAQHFDLAVTNPPTLQELQDVGERPNRNYSTDEILVTSYTADDTLNERPDNWKRWPIEKLTSTSVLKGKPVFQQDEIAKFSHALWLLNQELAKVYEKPADQFPIDVEWKIFGPQQTMIIKQARPFTAPLSR